MLKNKKTISLSNKQLDSFRLFRNEFKINYLSNKQATLLSKNNNIIFSLCGSDQIWNGEALWVNPFYFLYFSPISKNIAYAPSVGRPFVSKRNTASFRKLLKNVRNLSIRENSAIPCLENLTERKDIVNVCDPVLLINKEKWLSFSNMKINKKYSVCYLLNKPKKTNVGRIIDQMNAKCNYVVFIGVAMKEFKELFKFKYEFVDINVLDFPSLIFNSDEVITDSYHGLLFSVIGKRNIYLINRNYILGSDQSSRINDFLEILNFKLNNDFCSLIESDNLNYANLNKTINESTNYLLNAIEDIKNGK